MPKLLLPLAAVGLGAAGTTAAVQSREKKKAQERVEQFQSSEKKDWDRFTDNTARKSFVKQLGADPMTDPKLLQYADSMNRLKTGKKIADIPGDGGKSYQITKLRGSERLGCTCNDWRYKKSVAQPGEAQDCKHIQQFREMSKTAAARFQDNLPNPVIDGKPHDGTWTIVGSGRLSIPKKTSDIDYMVPLEEIGDLSSFNEYKDVPGAYWKDLDPVKGRPATVVAVPRYAYDKIDASYQQAVDRFGKRKLRQLKKTLPKDSFYKDIGVVYTSDAMKKEAAEVISALKPHQERVLRKIENSDGVIVAHRVGAGKTLTSIAAAVNSGLPIEVVTPASLTPNYEKELKKHVRGEVTARIRSYEKATRDAKEGKGIDTSRFLVIDEAHRLRNSGTLAASLLRADAAKAQKRLLLTGTALYNQPSDIAPLANIAAGKAVLPADPSGFDAKFIQETEVSPGLLQGLLGVQPGIKRSLKNRKALIDALTGRIDLHDEASASDFPVQVEEKIRVPMSETQHAVYETVMGAAPLHVRMKIKAGLPPSKQEAKDLNAFVAGGRQASLSPRPYVKEMTDIEERLSTPKIQEAVSRLRAMSKTDPNFRGVVYSNYVEAGLRPYEKSLQRTGIKFETLTGALTAKQKAQLVENYNSGKTPVLLVSSSGTEGLDLKGTKLVQVLEPHWNNSKIDQVIGRGVRYQSHHHLPPEERKVVVQRYYSTIPQGNISSLLNLDPGKSTEEWIQDRADEKTELARQMREVFQRASLIETKKEAGHVEDRIAERAPGAEPEVNTLRAKLRNMKLRKGQTYHIPLKRGRGYAVVGDVGNRHVVKTVLGPSMRPPGERLKVAEVADSVSRIRSKLKEGDILLMTPKQHSNQPALLSAPSAVFTRISTALQGSHAHSAIYVGKDRVVEARIEDGVQKRNLEEALDGIQSAIVVRPKASKKVREGAANFAESRVGRDYDSLAFLAGQGASLLIPEKMAKNLISRKQNPEDADKFICGNLVSASYAANGFSPNGEKHWDLTVPRDFLNPNTNKKVGVIGDPKSHNAILGRFAEQTKISSYGARKRDYKKEYAEYHAKPEQVENRSLRNQARRKLGLKKGDPREADHKTPLSKGGGNGHGNLRAVSRKTNRTKFTDPA
jgi:superfamily II DNA/RNA helicase